MVLLGFDKCAYKFITEVPALFRNTAVLKDRRISRNEIFLRNCFVKVEFFSYVATTMDQFYLQNYGISPYNLKIHRLLVNLTNTLPCG